MNERLSPEPLRRKSKTVKVGNVPVGHGHPISIQSMTKTKTADTVSTIKEIIALEEAGCEIVRCAVNDEEAAQGLKKIISSIHIPLVADIHFDYKLALMAIEAGVQKIRLNPGNIGNKTKIKAVVDQCLENNIPIRIGVNSGSLEKDILKKHGYPTADAMVDSALKHIEILEELGFYNTIVAMKSSNVWMTIDAYRKLSQKVDYPFHLGITEAGASLSGTIKSAIGIGTLLAEGIGDTIRVSLTGTGVEEIKAGREILKALGYSRHGVNIISCPTCGRLEGDLISIVKLVEHETESIKTPLTIAIMGCVVNGPGESKEADIGLSLGREHSILYVDGTSRGMISNQDAVQALLHEIQKKVHIR